MDLNSQRKLEILRTLNLNGPKGIRWIYENQGMHYASFEQFEKVLYELIPQFVKRQHFPMAEPEDLKYIINITVPGQVKYDELEKKGWMTFKKWNQSIRNPDRGLGERFGQ